MLVAYATTTADVPFKGPVVADLPATARVITGPAERWPIIRRIARIWRRDPVPMQADSPLVEVTIEGYTPAIAA